MKSNYFEDKRFSEKSGILYIFVNVFNFWFNREKLELIYCHVTCHETSGNFHCKFMKEWKWKSQITASILINYVLFWRLSGAHEPCFKNHCIIPCSENECSCYYWSLKKNTPLQLIGLMDLWRLLVKFPNILILFSI